MEKPQKNISFFYDFPKAIQFVHIFFQKILLMMMILRI